MVIRVNQAAEVTTSNGKSGSLDDGGREGTGTGGADHLVDAEGVGRQGEGGDGDLGGAGGAVVGGGHGLTRGDGGEDQGCECGDELHCCLECLGVVVD